MVISLGTCGVFTLAAHNVQYFRVTVPAGAGALVINAQLLAGSAAVAASLLLPGVAAVFGRLPLASDYDPQPSAQSMQQSQSSDAAASASADSAQSGSAAQQQQQQQQQQEKQQRRRNLGLPPSSLQIANPQAGDWFIALVGSIDAQSTDFISRDLACQVRLRAVVDCSRLITRL